MKNIFILIICLITLSCAKKQEKNKIEGLIIDPEIKLEVEKYIADKAEFEPYGELMQVYANSIDVEGFENDSLILVSKDPSKKIPFKSFYLWDNDTLSINGAYGLFGGTGFYIKLTDKKATLYHMLSSDDFPTYAYTETDSLIMRLEVPCTNTKIILSKIPNQTENQIIYGYVEFKSNEFFAAEGFTSEFELPKRKKVRNNMKIYFKSGLIILTE